ncbi:hypothetical protein B8A33_02680 [Dolosigranulum pigrum]|uniref:hypothetical protein n=1 Tax=Dolosigranulum pigrum TaxID=29394 RepID=UPI000DC025A0|nr:hypothetical protein [Dolosigranulum pigrum]RAN57068.1 hypothetical protein B8A33_02680 [Dolosigranulum pigrum]
MGKGKFLNHADRRYPAYMVLVRWLFPVYRMMGVNPDQVFAIVHLNMILDERKDKMPGMRDKNNNQLIWLILIFATLGIILLYDLFRFDTVFQQFSIFFTMFMGLMFFILITYFSDVLLKQPEQTLINAQPVTNQTAIVAKFTHIGLYVLLLSISLGAPSIVRVGYIYSSLIALLFALGIIIAGICVLLIINLVFLIIINTVGEQYLQKVLLSSQVVVAGVAILSGTILRESIEYLTDIGNSFEINLVWWQFLIFPMWFAAPFQGIINGFTVESTLFTLLLIISLIVSFVLYSKKAYVIQQNLLLKNSRQNTTVHQSLLMKLGRILSRASSIERPYFNLYWKLLSRDTVLKTKIYPNLVQGLIVPIAVLVPVYISSERRAFILENTPSSLFFILYTTTFALPAVIHLIQFSTSYNAFWLKEFVPNNQNSVQYRAAYKVILTKLLLPMYTMASILYILALGTMPIIILMNGYLYNGMVLYFLMDVFLKNSPFSKKIKSSLMGIGCFGQLVGMIIISLGIILIMFIASKVVYGNIILFTVQSIFILWVYKFGFYYRN